jgi:hypothetical protein
VKRIIGIVLIIFCFHAIGKSNSPLAKAKATFMRDVMNYYAKATANLHKRNVNYLNRGKKDSILTHITIDLSVWKYDEAKQQWVIPSPIGGQSDISFDTTHFVYTKDFMNGTFEAMTGEASGSILLDEYNAKQPQRQVEFDKLATFLYNINLINVPLLLIHKEYDDSNADTTVSVYETLKKLNYTSDDMWHCFMAENNELGESFFNSLNAYLINPPPYFILLFNSYSETIPIKNKPTRFRYYNFYAHSYVDEDLKQSLRNNLNAFLFNPSTTTEKVINSYIATLNCELFNDCTGIQFETQEANDFWIEFNAYAAGKGELFLADNKLKAIEIATRIDQLTNREFAADLAKIGLCYLDSTKCDEKPDQVPLASAIALKFFQSNIFTPVTNQGEVTEAILQKAGTIKFKVLQMGNETQNEIEFQFDGDQTKEEMKAGLTSLGLTFKNSYQYWLFFTDKDDTYGNYFYWLDHEYNKTPPTVLIIFAGFITGPASAVYGWVTGTDMLTGAELTGLDYVLNVFDLIPAVGLLDDLGPGFFKSIKITRAGKTFNLAGNTAKTYRAYHGAIKSFKTSSPAIKNSIYKCMSWGVDARFDEIEKSLVLMDKAGNEIGKIFPNKLELKSNQLVTTTGGQTLAVKADVFVDGQKSTSSYELVKKEDGDFGVRAIAELGEAIRGVTKTNFKSTFEAAEVLKDQAWELFKQEKWTDLESLINLNDLNWKWPPNGGFVDIEITSLEIGYEFDRYGGKFTGETFSDIGNYMSPKGASFESRALPPEYLTTMPYKKYKVVKKIDNVKKGKSIPWFSQTGNGIQFQTPVNINDLLEQGYIVELP